MSKRLLYAFAYAYCLISLSVSSCKKVDQDSPIIPGQAFQIPAPSPVNGSVSGRIVDENNTGVPSAIVKCGSSGALTDADGFFNINNITLDKYITTVTVTKPGYFKAYRSFSANASRNFVDIKLIPKTLSMSISSSVASTVTLSNSTEIKFQANSVQVKSSGAPYTGSVNVYAHYIDPTADDIASVVPGSFLGKDANNLYALQSTGMIAVEMESSAGEPLQLVTGMPATIKLPIPASLIASAPATIDTWSLDETGVWVKERTAAKTGNAYEFQATHFSFWNCDLIGVSGQLLREH